MAATCWVLLALVASLAPSGVVGVKVTSQMRLHGNPIRRVVTMLQDMQKSVEEEGAKEKELFEKFMCYCQNGAGSLDQSIETGKASIDQLSSKIEQATSQKAQLEQDVASHKSDREDAEKAMKESSAMREKEASEFAAASGENKANIEAMSGALAALKKGLSAALLQTNVGQLLRNVIAQSPEVTADQRETLASLLETGSSDGDTETGSDQIIGIVEQMKETMEADLKESSASEAEAKASFQNLMASKTKEISAASKAIEEKTSRVGQLAVEAVQSKADLEGTESSVKEDSNAKANMAKSCATKQQEVEERSKVRAEEIQAISETVEMLNGDDALELFKKTLPSAPTMFVQTRVTTRSQVRRAMSLLKGLLRSSHHSANIRMMLSSLHSRKGGAFDKVVKMLDNMIALLGKEQVDDDKKKDFCVAELDRTEDEVKELTGTVADFQADIEEMADSVSQVASEVDGLRHGLEELDKSVAVATEQRKAEHGEYTSTAAANQAALELIGMAKNRMNKFYNPSQYRAPAANEGANFLQVSLDDLGQYKKSEQSGGVLAMMEQMTKDVELDMQEGKMNEENSQKDYEEAMADAATKRTDDSQLIVTKEGEKSEIGQKLEDAKEGKRTKETLLSNTEGALRDLHVSCDLLLKNYDARKEARTKESEGLTQSKAVLAGASVGFLQRQ